MSRLKVVILGTRGFPDVQGGVERHCEELYPRLAKLGFDVTVFTRAPYIPESARVSEWKGVKFIHLWCPRRKSLEAIVHTFLAVLKARKLSPSIVHIHSIGPAILTPFAKIFLRAKVVITHHGPDYERKKWGMAARWVLRLGERWGVYYGDGIIAVSKGIKESIRKKYGKDAFFIPNGVNIPCLIPPGEEMKNWGIEAKKYVFTACRFVPEKGLHDLIAAYKLIENPLFKLVIAGDADHETSYSKKVKNMAKETPGVILTGFLSGESLGELFSNAGLFVLPSYYEGLPIAVLELLGYGLALIVSDIPSTREISLYEERYFRVGDIKALSEAMIRGFLKAVSTSEKEKYTEMLNAQYNWDFISLKTVEVYRSINPLNFH